MTNTLTMKKSAVRRWPFVAVTLGILAAGSGWWLTTHRTQAAGVAPGDQVSVDRFVRRLVASYDRSRQYRMLTEGERLPPISAPLVAGHPKPDWTAPMLITFGSEFAPQVKAIHAQLQARHVPLQLVHIMYNQAPPTADGEGQTTLTPAEVATFSNQVSLLDALSTPSAEVGSALKAVGVREAGYAFLRAADGRILYADDAIGLSTEGLMNAVGNYVKGGASAVMANQERPLVPGQAFPLTALPASVAPLLTAEVAKPRAVVFFSSTDCNVCTPWKTAASSYIQTWKKEGYGVVFIGTNQQVFAARTEADGSLHVDGSNQEILGRTTLDRLWNVRLYPAAYVLKDGKMQGEVSFLALKTDQREYYDVQFQAVQKIFDRKE